jgi:hypothetical protein
MKFLHLVNHFLDDWREKLWAKGQSIYINKSGRDWCEEWGIDATLITEEEFHYLSELDEFRRALWIAARKGV